MLHFHNPILSNAFFKEKNKTRDTDLVYSRRTHVEPHWVCGVLPHVDSGKPNTHVFSDVADTVPAT